MITMTPYYMGPPLINIPVGSPTYQTNLATEEGKNNFDRRYIYNQEVGWRERTANQQRTKDLDMTFGPALEVVGDGTVSVATGAANIVTNIVKYGLYLGAAVGIAYVGTTVALATYDGVERLVT